ncbi:MAG TPA: histone H1 [Candidatus Kapabacteria bacterium]|nr:histone H1 [Candidatus Kapabacteria bacterium]
MKQPEPEEPARAPEPARQRRGDFAQIARGVVEEATGEKLTPPRKASSSKNAVAAASGLKGGKARLTMTPEQRSEAARKAAQARWKKK